MQSMSLFIEKDTLVHKIDPISKIVYIVASIIIPFVLPSIKVTLVCLAVSILLLLFGQIFKNVLPLIGYSSLILVTIIIIQGLFNPNNGTPFVHIGPVTFYQEGLAYALLICFRVINILCAFSVLILTAKPSVLIEELVRRGLSPKFGYVLTSVLQIIPQMKATMGTITDAQRSRGMETEGNLIVRIKAFLPLLGPVVMNSLIQTRERAMALEVRGFNSKTEKTFLNERHHNKYGMAIQLGITLIIIFAIIWRIVA